MGLTDSTLDIANYIFGLINADKVTLGVEALFFGDQTKIPVTPTVCLEAGPKTRTIVGTSRLTQLQIQTYVIVYHNKVQDNQSNAREAIQLTEAIETMIHLDPQLGGLVVYAQVDTVTPGYTTRGNAQFKTSRLLVNSLTRKLLPSSP